jgi:hypothetical protein
MFGLRERVALGMRGRLAISRRGQSWFLSCSLLWAQILISKQGGCGGGESAIFELCNVIGEDRTL